MLQENFAGMRVSQILSSPRKYPTVETLVGSTDLNAVVLLSYNRVHHTPLPRPWWYNSVDFGGDWCHISHSSRIQDRHVTKRQIDITRCKTRQVVARARSSQQTSNNVDFVAPNAVHLS